MVLRSVIFLCICWVTSCTDFLMAGTLLHWVKWPQLCTCSVKTDSCGKNYASTILQKSSFVGIWFCQRRVTLTGSWCTLHFRNTTQKRSSMETPCISVDTVVFCFGRIRDTLAQPVTQTPASCQYLLSISLISSNSEMLSSCSPVLWSFFVRSWAGCVMLFMPCMCGVVVKKKMGSLSGRCTWSVVFQQKRAEERTLKTLWEIYWSF